MKVLSNVGKVPIKTWCDEIEDGALKQIINLSNLPFAFKWISIMPDCHQGYGMPIGGVLATKNVIIPNAVGVDIGCGMCAVKTSLTEIDTDTLKKIMGEIRKAVPVGFAHQKDKQDEKLMPGMECKIDSIIENLDNAYKKNKPYADEVIKKNYPIVTKEYNNALMSLGTLGGGNHFIEIQKGDDGHIWIMIHSGSRNLGFKVANHYNKVAQELNEKWHSSVPKEQGLAFLPVDSINGQNYIQEMNYCVEFALANRKLMMNRILEIIPKYLGNFGTYKINEKSNETIINIAHNYASLENHFGQNVWVHRKGATKATKGLKGIIPGSQGTSSYIVEGLGNDESFMSCSHGAGRKMSRTQAKNTLDLKEEIKKMNDKGIIHGMRHQNDLDEASSSYKDIDVVMENQKDLVKILVKLTPLAVIKG